MLKTALIGFGYWGAKLARNFQNSENFLLNLIVDKNKKNLLEAKKSYPLAKFFTDYRSAIKKNEIDLVIIATPTITHFNISRFALENNKHILVEKPLSLSIKEVNKLNSISSKKKKMIFVDYPFLFSGSINFIKKIINQNKYGKILEIESYREQAPIRNDVNVIWDLATHDISILTFLLNKMPYSINCIKIKNIKNSLSDTAYINLKYKKKINVIIKNSWVSPTKIRLIKIKFEKAILYCDENESLYKIKIYKRISNKDFRKYNIFIPEIDLNEPLAKLSKYISKSIKRNKNPLFQGKLNEKITYILDKINKSNV